MSIRQCSLHYSVHDLAIFFGIMRVKGCAGKPDKSAENSNSENVREFAVVLLLNCDSRI